MKTITIILFAVCIIIAGCDNDNPVTNAPAINPTIELNTYYMQYVENGIEISDSIQGTHLIYDIHDGKKFTIWNADELTWIHMADSVRYLREKEGK
jgi:hypothetical protein